MFSYCLCYSESLVKKSKFLQLNIIVKNVLVENCPSTLNVVVNFTNSSSDAADDFDEIALRNALQLSDSEEIIPKYLAAVSGKGVQIQNNRLVVRRDFPFALESSCLIFSGKPTFSCSWLVITFLKNRENDENVNKAIAIPPPAFEDTRYKNQLLVFFLLS